MVTLIVLALIQLQASEAAPGKVNILLHENELLGDDRIVLALSVFADIATYI